MFVIPPYTLNPHFVLFLYVIGLPSALFAENIIFTVCDLPVVPILTGLLQSFYIRRISFLAATDKKNAAGERNTDIYEYSIWVPLALSGYIPQATVARCYPANHPVV